MSDSEILGKADKALRPVLKELGRFPWIRIEGCCAGHKQEDTLWLELNILGASGLSRLMDLLRTLDSKLADTDMRVDCLLTYLAAADLSEVPHGWIPVAVEVFWPVRADWRRSQSMIVETMLSTIEEIGLRVAEPYTPTGAINYCPFCSSSLIRIDAISAAEHRYRCADCDMTWGMVDPVV